MFGSKGAAFAPPRQRGRLSASTKHPSFASGVQQALPIRTREQKLRDICRSLLEAAEQESGRGGNADITFLQEDGRNGFLKEREHS